MEEGTVSHWLIDPYKFSCTRYPLTIDEMSAEFESITNSPCTVKIIDSPAGPIRSFECGDTTWFLTEDEVTCQAAVSALKLPDSSISTWRVIPGEPRCEVMSGSLGQIVSEIENETGIKCKIKPFIKQEPSSRHIQCGQKNWIMTEDPASCQRLQEAYNDHMRHII